MSEQAVQAIESWGASAEAFGKHMIEWLHPQDPPLEVPTIITPGTAAISNAEVGFSVEQPEDPDLITDPIPVVIVHGFYGIEAAYGGFRNALAQQGRIVVTYGRAHQSLSRFLHPSQLGKPHRLISQAPLAVIRALDAEVDAIGHSYGGANAVDLAAHKPDHFRTVTIAASAGTNGHSLLTLAKNTPDETLHEVIPMVPELYHAIGVRGLWEAVRYGSNPIRLFSETFDVATRDVRHTIPEVQKHGIPVAAIQSLDDKFFPIHEVDEHIGELVDEFRVFPYPDAGHSAMMRMPVQFADFYRATVNKMVAKLQVAKG